MNQRIKAYLKRIPPLKQFLTKIQNLENRMTLQLTELKEENLALKEELRIWERNFSRLEEENAQQIRKLEEISVFLQQDNIHFRENCAIYEDKMARCEKDVKRLDARVDASNNHMNYLYYKGLHPDSYEVALKDWYYQRTGETLNLYNPHTFNEKIQWLKLFDNTPLKTQLADKYLVRKWVAEKIGDKYLIPLLGVWEKFDEIDFDKLPNRFVLKTNHGSGWNYIVKNKEEMNRLQMKCKFDLWMKKNYAFFGLELQYMNIPRKIIAEEYIENLDGDIFDYRFFCFNGEPKFVWVDIGSGTTHHKRNIYDMEWNLQEYSVNYPAMIPEPKKPRVFENMAVLARKLCAEFTFVRVDFYCVNDKIYFGEMTFTPQNGTGKWEDKAQDDYYGSLITLPEKKKIPERLY